LDVDALIWWLSSRQYAPEGGLAGRTNKLVDGCYSHWLGSCWPLIQAAVTGPRDSPTNKTLALGENLYSSEGLARYILCCCQAQEGGLRDKPSK
jgi:protein farnesyltransferase subunit beta